MRTHKPLRNFFYQSYLGAITFLSILTIGIFLALMSGWQKALWNEPPHGLLVTTMWIAALMPFSIFIVYPCLLRRRRNMVARLTCREYIFCGNQEKHFYGKDFSVWMKSAYVTLAYVLVVGSLLLGGYYLGFFELPDCSALSWFLFFSGVASLVFLCSLILLGIVIGPRSLYMHLTGEAVTALNNLKVRALADYQENKFSEMKERFSKELCCRLPDPKQSEQIHACVKCRYNSDGSCALQVALLFVLPVTGIILMCAYFLGFLEFSDCGFWAWLAYLLIFYFCSFGFIALIFSFIIRPRNLYVIMTDEAKTAIGQFLATTVKGISKMESRKRRRVFSEALLDRLKEEVPAVPEIQPAATEEQPVTAAEEISASINIGGQTVVQINIINK